MIDPRLRVTGYRGENGPVLIAVIPDDEPLGLEDHTPSSAPATPPRAYRIFCLWPAAPFLRLAFLESAVAAATVGLAGRADGRLVVARHDAEIDRLEALDLVAQPGRLLDRRFDEHI